MDDNTEAALETEWSVDYLLQACDDPSLLIPVAEAWDERSEGAKHLTRGDFKPREYLLSSLGMAARISPEVESSLRSPSPGRFVCGITTAQTFLTETAWMLEQAGFGVLLPAWWTRKGMRPKLGVRASVKTPKMTSNAGLSLDTLVDIDWEIVLGENSLTLEELEAVARQKSSLVKVRGQWVQLDAAEIEAAITFWKQHKAEQRSARDVVRIGLGATEPVNGLEVQGVKATGWMQSLLNGLSGQSESQEVAIPGQFAGTLRPYQHRGYAWMEFLRKWGLGACLADDMGLGKTCTTLALVQRQVETGSEKPVLIVCPTSVIGNWQKEVQRFTPQLRAVVHHGAARAKGAAFKKEIAGAALVLSSYALLSRDVELLKTVAWGGVILDEAQNIKNPETRQSKAARSLASDFRIALTGTPVENHIGDLWSLMEFTNPGFLGTQASFRRKFFVPIQVNGDADATAKLKQLTTPFVLRRLKTDKTIINDLPEKQEMKVFCTLTSEQATLYRAVVNELEQGIEGADGIQRSGVVLAALSKIKQICNHPAQFLKDNSGLLERSGKLTRITEMLQEVVESGDRALLFTQFAEMGELLKKHLQETFGSEVLFLHGGVSKKQRDAMVERFQSETGGPALFILSLRAGGTGLNLTAANHVFHFDRWWNPAVENQATDRAFRIGQKRNVQVHKFVCLGTLEERIDAMIESKHTLANKVVGTGEDWITKLSNADLKEMFALRADAISD
jgi:SNF2 family DNA or RNA helicase